MQEPRDEQLERLLTSSRPRPRLGFYDELEQTLFPSPVAPRRRFRPFAVGAAFAGALAAAMLALGLVGSGPLAPGGGDSSQADQHCRYVKVRQVKRVPRVVTDAAGHSRIEMQRKPVTRRVRRCS